MPDETPPPHRVRRDPSMAGAPPSWRWLQWVLLAAVLFAVIQTLNYLTAHPAALAAVRRLPLWVRLVAFALFVLPPIGFPLPQGRWTRGATVQHFVTWTLTYVGLGLSMVILLVQYPSGVAWALRLLILGVIASVLTLGSFLWRQLRARRFP